MIIVNPTERHAMNTARPLTTRPIVALANDRGDLTDAEIAQLVATARFAPLEWQRDEAKRALASFGHLDNARCA